MKIRVCSEKRAFLAVPKNTKLICHIVRIKFFQIIRHETLPVFSEDCHYILDLYAVQYNQLEILNGIGGIKWGN